MRNPIQRDDRLGLVHPATDVHTLGISSIEQILRDCGFKAVVADPVTCKAFDRPADQESSAIIEKWIRNWEVTCLGFSYRLDPEQGASTLGALVRLLKERRLLSRDGGPIKGVFFAGLPETCQRVRERIPEVDGTFCGDETPAEALNILGIPSSRLPNPAITGLAYDEARLAFGKSLIAKGGHLGVLPTDRSGYQGFGTEKDSMVARCRHAMSRSQAPLLRAHAGPYLQNRLEAVRLFTDWTRQLAASGFLDVLSIGTSQLTQSDFGQEWDDRPNGGGVPLNSPEEFAAIWKAARPMLVRTYAGTRDIPTLARMYEETIHIAWHALSLWWFSRLDGRGPYSLKDNLRQHLETFRVIAGSGKPLETNVPHHFAFRGADDVTYVVSSVLAARTAKRMGIRHFVLQIMLNTPKYTWGVQDLAKARSTLRLVRELQDDDFVVFLQPRGGLDYFSHDPDKAKAQLAAVTALMDDIEPLDRASPPLIHVVSYCEGSHLADPPAISESVQITRHALQEYRRLRSKGDVDDMTHHPEVDLRTEELLQESRRLLSAIDSSIRQPCSPDGLYQAFSRGFLPVPYLWNCREEFPEAVRWRTGLVRGSVKVLDDEGLPLSVSQRLERMAIDRFSSIT